MTGRDLIMYILQHNLEDELVFKDNIFLGFITEEEAAAKYGVGTATIRAWVIMGRLDGVIMDDKVYISPNSKAPFPSIGGF